MNPMNEAPGTGTINTRIHKYIATIQKTRYKTRMTTLEIPDSLFQRLQKHAIPLVDTPLSVIERWADHFEATLPAPPTKTEPTNGIAPSSTNRFDPLNPPDLLHTRVEGSFGARHFRKWNELVRLAHVEAFAKAGSFEALRAATHSQIRRGNHDGDSGYSYIPEIDISVQGVDAKHAWTYALRLAQYVKVPLRVSIHWRNNEKAAFPGETGILEWLSK
ncbi:MAG: hypothetical protein ABIS50_07640 [Luteolibacter sp.]|uniref:T4SS efffector SepA family protein n=1 Tax=Luteolibacter sp. TaxID=1962973 RepID=UPI003263C844